MEETADKILNLIKQNPNITQKDIEKNIGLTRRGVEWNINKLKEKGILLRHGPTKSGYWEVITKEV